MGLDMERKSAIQVPDGILPLVQTIPNEREHCAQDTEATRGRGGGAISGREGGEIFPWQVWGLWQWSVCMRQCKPW